MLGIKLGVNLEVKLGVESKTGSKNSVLAFLKCMDGSVLAFLKCTDGSVLVFLKCMDGSVLAHLRIHRLLKSSGGRLHGKPEVGQYGTVHALRKTNTDPSVHFRKANTDLSMHFRKANTEFLLPVLLPTPNFTSKFSPSFIPNITINLVHHDECNIISQVTVS